MKKSHFRYWELALLLALAVTILWGAASLGQQEELGRKVIRLHVIANSDSPEDQALKLRVRDRVLARAQEILEQSADMEQAEQALTAALPELTREARETLAAMMDEDAELISIYYGEDISDDRAAQMQEAVEAAYPDCDVEVHSGGQPIYYYVISVE